MENGVEVADDETRLRPAGTDAAAEAVEQVASPQSEVVDGDAFVSGVEQKNELRDDEENEVFEEAVEDIPQPAVPEQQHQQLQVEVQQTEGFEDPLGIVVDGDEDGGAAAQEVQVTEGVHGDEPGRVEEGAHVDDSGFGGGDYGHQVPLIELACGDTDDIEISGMDTGEINGTGGPSIPLKEGEGEIFGVEQQIIQGNQEIGSHDSSDLGAVGYGNLENGHADAGVSLEGKVPFSNGKRYGEDYGVSAPDVSVGTETNETLHPEGSCPLLASSKVDDEAQPAVVPAEVNESVHNDDEKTVASTSGRQFDGISLNGNSDTLHASSELDKEICPEEVNEAVEKDDKVKTEGLTMPTVNTLPISSQIGDKIHPYTIFSEVNKSKSEDSPVAVQSEEQMLDGRDKAEIPVAVQSEEQMLDGRDKAEIRVLPKVNNGYMEESVTVEDVDESATSSEDDNGTTTQPSAADSAPKGSSSTPSVQSHPAGLVSSAPLSEPSARTVQQSRVNGSTTQRQVQSSEDSAVNGDVEEYDETRERLQMIRVKFLRLAHRLGQTPHNVVVAQVLYRLGLAEQLRGSMNTSRAGAFSFDRASAMAEQLETAGQEPLDFSCTIMVIGKTGVGKSATINSIFDDSIFKTDAFQSGTKTVQDMVGTVQGIKVRVIDTPGLLPSSMDQWKNEKILNSVKRFIKKTPPDVIMYLDRLDMQSRDLGDVPLLRTITNVFGPSIWFNAIVVLTHAASAPPEGANGSPLSYEMYITQRTHVIQNAIRHAAGDPRLLNPVSLVENHPACRMNRAGQRVLPNGQVWKPHLLLLSFASKILTEANMLLKLQDSPAGRPFGARSRAPPLPFFLSSLLQSRPPLKMPHEQTGDDDSMDIDMDGDSDSGNESDYDELPPFKSLTKEQISRLSKVQKKAYYEEIDYREKLFYKKQLNEEKKRRKLLKKMTEAAAKELPEDYSNENVEEDSGPASVPVLMPDSALPPSFDSDYPSHRYRFLDSSNQWLVRPVLETQGWDHDVGYEGLNVEKMFAVKDKIPVSVSGQLSKDKKECTLQMEIASTFKHGDGKSTSLGLDLQSLGKDMAYTLRGETRFNFFRCNSAAAGVSSTLLGDTLSAGLKFEDEVIVNKRFRMLLTGGAMSGRGDLAYGGRVEATLKDKDHPLGRALHTLALSVVDWHGDLAIGCNLQSQIPVGRHTNVIGHANLSNKGTGQVSIRVNSSEQLQLALIALVPIFRNAKRLFFGSSEYV